LIIYETIYESKDYTVSENRKENLMKMTNLKESVTIPTITPPFSPESFKNNLDIIKSQEPISLPTSVIPSTNQSIQTSQITEPMSESIPTIQFNQITEPVPSVSAPTESIPIESIPTIQSNQISAPTESIPTESIPTESKPTIQSNQISASIESKPTIQSNQISEPIEPTESTEDTVLKPLLTPQNSDLQTINSNKNTFEALTQPKDSMTNTNQKFSTNSTNSTILSNTNKPRQNIINRPFNKLKIQE